MVSAPLWLKSDRTRRIVSLVCFFLVELFVLINLILTGDHPTAGLSWTTIDFDGGAEGWFGLIKWRSCNSDGSTCGSIALRDLPDRVGPGHTCADAGGWVIASYVILMVLTILPLFIMLNCGCIRVPYPRTAGLFTTFAMLVWSIVAVSKWFEACHNRIECNGCTKKPGYAVALGILTIVILFIGMVFYWWRVIRPQKDLPATTSREGIVDSSVTSDGYAASSPAGGQFGGYSNYANPAANPNAYAMGAAALSNPHVQQFGMAAASNPQVQQWGAQQVKNTYGY